MRNRHVFDLHGLCRFDSGVVCHWTLPAKSTLELAGKLGIHHLLFLLGSTPHTLHNSTLPLFSYPPRRPRTLQWKEHSVSEITMKVDVFKEFSQNNLQDQ